MKQKKIVIAPDSFKESLSALEVEQSIQEGLKKVWPAADYVLVPMADGGEGTVRSLVDARKGRIIHEKVTGPLGKPLIAFYGLINDNRTAVIEMAAAAGIEHIKQEERDPLVATTYGGGELIRSALDQGARHIILGLGGSATNDGGCGMAQALGAHLLDADGHGIDALFSIVPGTVSLDLALKDARINLIRTASNVARVWQVAQKK